MRPKEHTKRPTQPDLQEPERIADSQQASSVGSEGAADAELLARLAAAEKALAKSEERLEIALEAGHIGLWERDLASGKMNWSDSFFRLLGLKPGEIEPSYEAGLNLLPPEDATEVAQAIKAARIDRTEFKREHRVVWPDGTTHWVVSRGRFVYDTLGNAMRMVGVSTDIDDRKRSEELIRAQEQRYRAVFDASVNGLLVVRSDGTVLDANLACCQMHRVGPEAIRGMQTAQFVHPDSLFKFREFFENVSANRSYHCEAVGIRLDGEPFDAEVDGVPFNQGAEAHALAIIRDISERKRAERELQESNRNYRGLFNNSLAGVAITNSSGRLFEANDALCEMLGYTRKELQKLDVRSLYTDPNARKEFLDKLRDHGKARDYQFELVRKDGSTLWASFSSAVIQWQKQDAVITTVVDVTARKLAEANYQQLVELVNCIVFQSDADTFRMTYVSPHAERLLGYPLERWLEEPHFWESRIHPDDRETAVCYCANETEEGRDHAFQFRMLAADGREVWIYKSVRLIRDPSNRVRSLHGVMLDITEQKLIEQKLQETEELFRLVAQSVTDLIWIREASSDQLTWLGDIDGALGYDSNEFPRTHAAYAALIHPEDYETVMAAGNVSRSTPGTHSVEYRIRGKDGQYRHWVDNWETIANAYGEPIRVVGAVRDITDRKLVEREREARFYHLHVMDRLNQIIVESTDVQSMLDRLVGELLESLGADRVWLLYPCDPQAEEFSITIERTSPEYPGAFATGERIPNTEMISSHMEAYLESEGPMALPPETISKLFTEEAVAHFNIKSQLGVVLRPKRGAPWLLGIHQCSYYRAWNDDEILLLDSAGRRIADALSQMLIQGELQASEMQLARAQSIAKLGSFQTAFEDNFATCSEELCSILGLPPENRTPTLQTLFNRVLQEDRRRFVKDFRDAREGRPLECESEYRVVLPDGRCRYLSSNIEVTRDHRGTPIQLVGTLQDITERKLAQESLRNSEIKYRTLVETSPYCILQIDALGRILSMNRAGLEMLDVSNEDAVIGLPYLDAVCEKDRYAVSLLLDGSLAGESSEFEFRSVNGLDLRSTFVPVFKPDGKVDRLLGLTQNITALRIDQLKLAASEARYRTLMEDANDAIILINAETGMLIDANQEAQEMLGRSQEEILQMHFSDLYPGSEHEQHRDMFLLQLEQQSGVLGESYVVDRAGRQIPVEISSSVIEMENTRVVQGIYRNLTERRRIEQELQQKKAEIARVSRLSTLGEITSGIAHELNQPLTAIANYVEALRDLIPAETSETEDLRKILTSLGNTTFRTSTIISRLRGLVQKAAPHRSARSLNDLTEEMLSFYLPRLENSGIRVQLDLAEDLPKLLLDAIQIQQVLLNLVKNSQEAMKDTASDCRSLIIRTCQIDDRVELAVSDTGRGLPTKDTERLFDYFFSTTPDGLGVGLQVCRSIMESHHGSVEAENNPLGGATFRLKFPFQSAETDNGS